MADPYVRLLVAQVRSQTQYRLSFALDLAFSTVLTSLDLVTLWVLFTVNGDLGGFGGEDVLLMAGIAACAFPVADLAVGNTEKLRVYVRSGLFDAVLLRPLSALGQLVVMDFAPRRVGRVLQGTAVYVAALVISPVQWSPPVVVLAVVAPLAGAVFFGAIFVAGATVAFWWIDSGEMSNAFTYGGKDVSAYPATVFGGLFRRVFVYGLGFAFVSYLPALAMLGRSDPLGTPDWLRWCSPLTSLVFAVAAGLFWRTGVRHYRSTGS
ncbi:ABC transporter permease [Actinophytocola oryzae]|uniref:ABC-2 type transport system permease protein n=1 Tax=Actinophytocola oryzae TaxID=502181 RepID=A0A4R7UZ08_9PSEU|nr:ABC-2 family transporter protein [Actinophytocola oryzae]TDV40316.1 ABC-2 type transport system permease protein [Actinophytocola oryzae]